MRKTVTYDSLFFFANTQRNIKYKNMSAYSNDGDNIIWIYLIKENKQYIT